MKPQDQTPERLLALAKMGDRAAADELRRQIDRFAPREINLKSSLKGIAEAASANIAKARPGWPSGRSRISLITGAGGRSATLTAADIAQSEEAQYRQHLSQASLSLVLSENESECFVSMSATIGGVLHVWGTTAGKDDVGLVTIEEAVAHAGRAILMRALHLMGPGRQPSAFAHSALAVTELLNATGILFAETLEGRRPDKGIPLGNAIMAKPEIDWGRASHTAMRGRNPSAPAEAQGDRAAINIYTHTTPPPVTGDPLKVRYPDRPDPDLPARLNELARLFSNKPGNKP